MAKLKEYTSIKLKSKKKEKIYVSISTPPFHLDLWGQGVHTFITMKNQDNIKNIKNFQEISRLSIEIIS